MSEERNDEREERGEGSRHPERANARHPLHPHNHAEKHYSAEEFDDEFDDIDQLLPEEARGHVREAVEQLLPSNAVIVDTTVGTPLALDRASARIHHHFAESDLGYRPDSTETLKLRVRGSTHPYFGSFSGRVSIIEDIGDAKLRTQGLHVYRIDGLLKFRLSMVFVTAVALFFFLLLWWTNPGFWPTVLFFFIGVGTSISAAYTLGQNQRDEIVERVDESLLRLRSTINNHY